MCGPEHVHERHESDANRDKSIKHQFRDILKTSPRCWLSKILTVAMLAGFAVGCWFTSQSAFQSNGVAYSSPVAPPTGSSSLAIAPAASSEPQYLTKNIEDVQKGDFVLARDEHRKEIGYRRVVEVYRRTSFHLRHLKFRDANGQYQTLSTTDEHPFLDAESNQFVNAGDLKELTKVTGPSGELQTLVLSKREEHPEGVPVFNFQVEGFHTYYVHQPGATVPVLVHNANYNVDGSSVDELIAEAQLKYPGKAGKIEDHHIRPKYFGGDPTGPTAPLDAAYHQMITNAFRENYGYGQSVPSPERVAEIMQTVYDKLPLP